MLVDNDISKAATAQLSIIHIVQILRCYGDLITALNNAKSFQRFIQQNWVDLRLKLQIVLCECACVTHT